MVTDPPSKDSDLLGEVSPDKSFNLCDGSSISSLSELYSTLQNIADDSFNHHVSGERNDFGNWVRDVHKDYKLANSIFLADSKDCCVKAVGDRIYEIEKMTDQKQRSMVLPSPPKEEPKTKVPNTNFQREAEIAQAILQRKPISNLLPSKEKKRPAPSKEKISKPKGELETASERLEKIISDAAKTKIKEIEAKKLEAERPLEFKEELKAEAEPVAVAQETFSEMPEPEAAPEEIIKLVESKSFASQVKSDMASLFSTSSMSGFARDMKKIVPSGKTEDNVIQKPVSTGNTKEKMLTHLKKVYK